MEHVKTTSIYQCMRTLKCVLKQKVQIWGPFEKMSARGAGNISKEKNLTKLTFCEETKLKQKEKCEFSLTFYILILLWFVFCYLTFKWNNKQNRKATLTTDDTQAVCVWCVHPVLTAPFIPLCCRETLAAWRCAGMTPCRTAPGRWWLWRNCSTARRSTSGTLSGKSRSSNHSTTKTSSNIKESVTVQVRTR